MESIIELEYAAAKTPIGSTDARSMIYQQLGRRGSCLVFTVRRSLQQSGVAFAPRLRTEFRIFVRLKASLALHAFAYFRFKPSGSINFFAPSKASVRSRRELFTARASLRERLLKSWRQGTGEYFHWLENDILFRRNSDSDERQMFMREIVE